ncbi:MAG TPA: hypothetical protein VG842_05700, partial [Sediminibacterium sp.]|nr:hypothetical protein [Sediminibacterium sp.]
KVSLAKDGSFSLKNTLFADSAFFIFSPNRKVRNNYLSIHIKTLLDSAFVPVCMQTDFITVGKLVADRSSQYHFNIAAIESATLPEVIVTGHTKNKMQLYDEAYSSSMFQRNDAIVFDGLDDDQISRSISVLQFLRGRVPGLTIVKNEDGLDLAKWRNEVAEIYVDEFRLDASELNFISPLDVAMIKVYRPPAQLSPFSGSAGAIAIYTKKGAFADDDHAKHHFIVKGYTSLDSNWQ